MKKCLVVLVSLLILLDAVVVVGVMEHKEIVSSKEEKIQLVTAVQGELVQLPEGNWSFLGEKNNHNSFENNLFCADFVGRYEFINDNNQKLVVDYLPLDQAETKEVELGESKVINTNYPSDISLEADVELADVSFVQEVYCTQTVQLPEGDWFTLKIPGLEFKGNNIVTFQCVGYYEFADNLDAPTKVLQVRCQPVE